MASDTLLLEARQVAQRFPLPDGGGEYTVLQAVDLALAATILVLGWLGGVAARRAGLGGWGVVASAGFVGLLGVVLILLKAALH